MEEHLVMHEVVGHANEITDNNRQNNVKMSSDYATYRAKFIKRIFKLEQYMI